MDSEFIVTVRKATRNLPPPDEVIEAITILRSALVKEAEVIILKNENIGRRFLISNMKEIRAELDYTGAIVKSRLEKMQKEGLDAYNADFSNTQELTGALCDALHYLKELWKTYFKDSGKPAENAANTIIQNAEKIYNIDHIDNANFS